MPRSGIDYHIDDLWRARVRERLTALDKRPAWLAAESGCPKSLLSELLAGKRSNTTYLPELHRALGWAPPQGPLLSEEDEELLRIARALSPEQRARLLERALTLEEAKKKG